MSAQSTLTGVKHPTGGSPASAWVQRWVTAAKAGTWGLDLACGDGRNTGVLLNHGLRVIAVDRDVMALEALANRYRGQVFGKLLQLDLEDQPWQPQLWAPAAGFGAIVTCNYLHRPRMALLLGLLQPGGWWIHETFMRGHEQFGRPRNPDFLLQPGELLGWAEQGGLRVIGFEQGKTPDALVQRIAAQRPLPNLASPDQLQDWPQIG